MTSKQQGQSVTEYMILLVLIVLVSAGAVRSIGGLIRSKLETARRHIDHDITFSNVR